MKSKKFLIIISFIFLCFLTASCGYKSKGNHEEDFTHVKVGMTEKEVLRVMGKANEKETYESATNKESYNIYYWFNGAINKDDAEKQVKKGINVRYFCIVITLKEGESTYKVKEKDDIIKGNWGIS